MATASVVVDDRVLQRRLRRLRSRAESVLRKARTDAARKLKNKAKRDIGRKLNLPLKRIGSYLRVSRRSGEVAFHIRYAREPAHHFRGWVYREVVGSPLRGVSRSRSNLRTSLRGRQVQTERASGRIRQVRATAQQYRNRGLIVRFRKDEEPITYVRAFRTPSVGQGRVFIQRVAGAGRKPLEAITGPSVHGEGGKNLNAYRRFGLATMAQRMQHWVDREANTV